MSDVTQKKRKKENKKADENERESIASLRFSSSKSEPACRGIEIRLKINWLTIFEHSQNIECMFQFTTLFDNFKKFLQI